MIAPSLQPAADEYLALRRSFGYRLAGFDRPLADFVGYLDRAGLDTVTIDAALSWAVQSTATPLRHAQRLSIARGFATYLHSLDPRSEVPPRGLLPEGRRRVPPHIYTSDEIAELMAQSRRLQPPLRAATMETVIGLLVATGIRSGEAVRLDRGDVDLEAGRVRIIATKFNKSRELALHPTVADALAGYAQLRDRHWPQPATLGFFVSGRGGRFAQGSLNVTFAELVRRDGPRSSWTRCCWNGPSERSDSARHGQPWRRPCGAPLMAPRSSGASERPGNATTSRRWRSTPTST